MSHTENAEEEGRCVVLGLPKLYSVYSNHGVRRGEATLQPEDGGTHRTGSIARRWQLRQRVAERGPFGGTICPEQRDRNSGDGEDVPDHEPVEGELGASRSMKTGQKKKRLLGGIKKTKTLREKWYETIKEEEKLQSNKDVTVQCIDFCEVTTSDVHAVLRHAPPLLQHPPCSGGNCGISGKTHISVYRSSMQPGSRSFEVHTYCYGY